MIEVLKQALEALEATDQLINGSGTQGGLVYCMDGYYSDCFDVDPINKQTDEAIAAIKEALAQQEQEPVAWAVYCDGFIALPSFDSELEARQEMQRRNRKFPHNKRKVKALYDTPPQRTEPKVCCQQYDICLEPCTPRGRHLAQQEQEPVVEMEALADNDSAYAYADGWNACVRKFKATHPPQRTWVGLTEDELIEAWHWGGCDPHIEGAHFKSLYQYFEAKLKDKNG